MHRYHLERETSGPEFDNKLIQLVKANPAIYDVSHPHYRRNPVRVGIWDRIAAQLGAPSRFLQTKWKNIRYNYLQEVKCMETGVTNPNIRKRRFTEDLSFLQHTAQAYNVKKAQMYRNAMGKTENGSDNDSNGYVYSDQDFNRSEVIEIGNSDDESGVNNFANQNGHYYGNNNNDYEHMDDDDEEGQGFASFNVETELKEIDDEEIDIKHNANKHDHDNGGGNNDSNDLDNEQEEFQKTTIIKKIIKLNNSTNGNGDEDPNDSNELENGDSNGNENDNDENSRSRSPNHSTNPSNPSSPLLTPMIVMSNGESSESNGNGKKSNGEITIERVTSGRAAAHHNGGGSRSKSIASNAEYNHYPSYMPTNSSSSTPSSSTTQTKKRIAASEIMTNLAKRKAMPAPFPCLTPINDPIELYCLSLVDCLRNMPRSERERVKFEFANILKDAKYKDQS